VLRIVRTEVDVAKVAENEIETGEHLILVVAVLVEMYLLVGATTAVHARCYRTGF
jgi:hypothetical protein